MKKIITTLLFASSIGLASAQVGTSATATAQGWSGDNAHSSVRFAITHMMVAQTVGQFTDYTIKVNAAKENFSDATFNITIKTESVNTGAEDRDKHLKSPDFFDAANNPEITFKSTAFKNVKGNQYKLEGDLTMHGVTKKVTLDVMYTGTKNDPWGNTKAGFAIRGQVNRSDFGMNWNVDLKEGGKLLSDTVDIMCDVELKKDK